ncbi:TIGR02391 family protein, partial [Nocardiopsis protaetiae]
QVIRYCEEEILRQSVFHAVFEATKGLAERLREMSGSTLDGADLVDHCFSTRRQPPLVRINGFATESEISEHKGFANLLKGVFGTFRNPPAHTPRATAGWRIPEPDALDLFSTLSFMHRRLDTATVTHLP